MKQIKFCIEYFEHSDPARREEIHKTLLHNLFVPEFDEVLLFSDVPVPEFARIEKVTVKPLNKRLEYSDFLECASDLNKVYVLANADIQFQSGIPYLGFLPLGQLWALTRWEANGSLWPARRASQDAWAVRGGEWNRDLLETCKIQLGWPGCENALAGRFHEAGFKVKNYCRDIRTLHVHADSSRNYGERDRIPRPYYFPDPQKVPLSIKLRYELGKLFR